MGNGLSVTLVGAGSTSFTQTLVEDLVQDPVTRDCEFRLYDIDARAAAEARSLIEMIQKDWESSGTVAAYDTLQQAVTGARYVICTILVGGREAVSRDFATCHKYGIRNTVGDTLGLTGMARAVRMVPVLVDIARVCENVAPEALLLNYTNPMGMLVAGVAHATGFPVVGMCHSAAYTVDTLASYVRVGRERVRWQSAGINHLAWMLLFEADGVDLYPALAEAALDDDVYRRDPVRFELLKRFGYFVTESSKHVAEYVPWFINHPQEIERLEIPVDEYLRRSHTPLTAAAALEARASRSEKVHDREPSNEYAPRLISAKESGRDWCFQANILNDGLIDNLSRRGCVEVECVVSNGRLAPTRFGMLPSGVAAVTQQALAVQELTVESILTADRDLFYQAALMDPQVAARLSVDEARRLVDEILEAQGEELQWRSHRLGSFGGIR
ncbi:MAG: family 4 glycosyl hydrolase [Acidimicrobiales bacterium]